MTVRCTGILPSQDHPWIKVCGIRTFADLEACASAEATHVGFNSWPHSPRCVGPERVGPLADAARELGLVPVVLCVPGSLLTAGGAARLGVWLQCPSPVPDEEVGGALGIIEARTCRPGSLSGATWGEVLLLDAHSEDLPGGTGKAVAFDQALLAPRPFILAGGLKPDTVAAAVEAVAPAGVDAASGLESRPGVKDPGRIRAFCISAREAFLRLRQTGLAHHRGTEYTEEMRKKVVLEKDYEAS